MFAAASLAFVLITAHAVTPLSCFPTGIKFSQKSQRNQGAVVLSVAAVSTVCTEQKW